MRRLIRSAKFHADVRDLLEADAPQRRGKRRVRALRCQDDDVSAVWLLQLERRDSSREDFEEGASAEMFRELLSPDLVSQVGCDRRKREDHVQGAPEFVEVGEILEG